MDGIGGLGIGVTIITILQMKHYPKKKNVLFNKIKKILCCMTDVRD